MITGRPAASIRCAAAILLPCTIPPEGTGQHPSAILDRFAQLIDGATTVLMCAGESYNGDRLPHGVMERVLAEPGTNPADALPGHLTGVRAEGPKYDWAVPIWPRWHTVRITDGRPDPTDKARLAAFTDYQEPAAA